MYNKFEFQGFNYCNIEIRGRCSILLPNIINPQCNCFQIKYFSSATEEKILLGRINGFETVTMIAAQGNSSEVLPKHNFRKKQIFSTIYQLY